LSTLETKFFQVFHRDVGVGWRLKPRLRLQSPPSGTYNSPTKVGFATVARDFSRWALRYAQLRWATQHGVETTQAELQKTCVRPF
jgi:hypothetical protein